MGKYDLSLGNVIGETKKTETPIKKEKKEPPKKKVDYTLAWVCLPRTSDDGTVQVLIREVTDCTPELFKEWVEYVLPSQRKKNYSLKKFNTAAKRYKAHAEMINQSARIRDGWYQNSSQQIFA